MKALCLPFSQIPHTTRLFLDFLAYTPAVQSFYPHSPYFHEWMKSQAQELRYDPARRQQLSAILERQNRSWDASPQTLANIQRLRNGAFAAVTGQQVGLLGGPMFAVYKALSAVKLAEEATAAGIDTVPVFWLATYDHDLAEVNHVAMPGPDRTADGTITIKTITTPSHGVAGAPVSEVRFGDEILPVIEEAKALLGDTEVTRMLTASYRPGESMGSAFAKFFATLFAGRGVIVLDASDPELHRVAAPMYRAAIERADDIISALLARGQALEKADYCQQVKVTQSSVLLFTLQDGARKPIHRRANPDGEQEFVIGTEAGAEKLSAGEMIDRIESAPENFSPNVLLRPVVQDYLLPTLAYAGGAAEAAYFAQAGAVYQVLLGRVTGIVPRFSATLVEPKVQRWLRHYGIPVRDVFQDSSALRRELSSRTLPEGVQAAFDSAQQSVESSLALLRASLEQLDPTLLGASETAASKINYQLGRLRQLASTAELRKNELLSRHAQALGDALYPYGALQERGIAGAYYLARHGTELLQTIYDAIGGDCHDHQVLDL